MPKQDRPKKSRYSEEAVDHLPSHPPNFDNLLFTCGYCHGASRLNAPRLKPVRGGAAIISRAVAGSKVVTDHGLMDAHTFRLERKVDELAEQVDKLTAL